MATNAMHYDLALTNISNLDYYTNVVNSTPLLSAEEEYELANRWQNEGDLEAAQRLILSHLRFVHRIAKSYSGYGLPVADLIQEGNIGLMKAVKSFDPEKGVRLVSFAVHWIRAEIHEYVIRNWRIVKIATTKAQRKLFFNLRNAKKRLGWLNNEEAQTVADDLGVTLDNVLDMENRLAQPDTSFDAPVDADSESDDSSDYCPAAYVRAPADSDPSLYLEKSDFSAYRKKQLSDALVGLDERSRDIVTARWLNEDGKTTLQTLAKRYKVSIERIRQIEQKAMNELQEKMVTA